MADEKMVTLTCAQGHENARALPYDMKLLDWCSTCGQVFGDGERDPPRYMPACALADPQDPQAADTIERLQARVGEYREIAEIAHEWLLELVNGYHGKLHPDVLTNAQRDLRKASNLTKEG